MRNKRVLDPKIAVFAGTLLTTWREHLWTKKAAATHCRQISSRLLIGQVEHVEVKNLPGKQMVPQTKRAAFRMTLSAAPG
jgi:hypothetical protein